MKIVVRRVLAAGTYPFQLQRLQTKIPRTTGIFPRRTPVCEWHFAFKIPSVNDYSTHNYAGSKYKS
jgi:hypothetical protein